MKWTTALCIAFAGLAAASCARFEPEPEVLRLRRFKQAGAQGVLLNETLVFHFSAELDRTSVTRESVRITDADGGSATGSFEIQGEILLFRPTLPKAADLSDGGLLPDRRYRVHVLGFPLPDGVRGRSGAPLDAAFRSEFVTASLARRDVAPIFEDESLDHAMPLTLASALVGSLEPIRLECDEPLDPSTLFDDDFQLKTVIDGKLTPIDVRALLVENERDRARIQLVPVRRDDPREELELRPGDYQLWLADDSRLQDFGRHPVQPGWSRKLILRVAADESEGPPDTIHVDFRPPFAPSPLAVAGADGRAHWDGDVTVRLPRSCGNGADGAVELAGREERVEWNATRLSVPAGAECELVAPGTVVLRAQGCMEIAGVLRRAPTAAELAWRAGESHAEWIDRTAADWPVPSMQESLSVADSVEDWLAGARAADSAWTVLVAGGDLVVSGEVHVDGPLLLVSGGLIRATGSVRSRKTWRVGAGGGVFDPPSSTPKRGVGLQAEELGFEVLRDNVLADTYRFAVLSNPIRPPSRIRRWLPAAVRSRAGQGEVEVRYLGAQSVGPTVSAAEALADPSLLADAEALRLLIELRVGPGDYWDPPRVDFVELTWQ